MSGKEFVELLIENTEHGLRDEGVYFSDTLKNDSWKMDCFKKSIKDFKEGDFKVLFIDSE